MEIKNANQATLDLSVNKLVLVKEVVTSRYRPEQQVTRPTSWDARIAGLDTIHDSEGNAIVLESTGQQSTPAPGWTILLRDQKPSGAWSWTVYGMAANSK